MNPWDHDPSPVPVPAPTVAWDQLVSEGEDTDAFLAFSRWLSEDPGFTHTASTRRWSAQWRWRSRRAQYVRSLAAASARAAHETAAEIGTAHAEALRDLRELGHEAIAALSGKDLKPRDALAILTAAIELERLRLGEPGAIVRTDLSGASDQDLDALEAALAAATGKS